MADTAITRVPSGHDVSYRQTVMPSYSSGTFLADDTDYHVLVLDSRGKRFLTYGVDNPSNKDLAITLYGSPSETAGVGDAGVFLIGTSITALAGNYIYDTTDDGFIYYIVRCKFAEVPNESTVTVYAYLMQ